MITRTALICAGVAPLLAAAAEPAPFDAATERAVRAAIETPALVNGMNFSGKPQFDVSADGRTVVYAVEQPDLERNVLKVTLWIREVGSTNEPRRLLDVRSGLRPMGVNPSFSPDARRIAITGFGDEGNAAIVDVASGEARVLKPDFSKVPDAPDVAMLMDVEWAPTGNRIALQVVPRPAPPPARVGVSVTPEWNGATLSDRGDRLVVVHADTSVVLAMTRADVDVTGGAAFDWSPDGTRIAFSARPLGSSTFDGKWTDLFVLDAAGITQDLVRDPGLDMDPHWSPDGRYVAYVSEGGEFSWASRRRARIIDLASGERRTLPQAPGAETSAYALAWSGTEVLYTGMRSMGCPVIAVSVDRNTARQLSPDDLSCYGAARTAKSGMLFLSRQTYESPSDLVMTRMKRWKPQSVARLASPPGLPRAIVKAIDWPSQDGRFRIPGVLILPDDGGSQEKRPLLVSIAGGPSMIMPSVYNAHAQHLVYPALLRGFAVLLPNTRGRGGYGPDFQQALVKEKNFLKGPLEDVLSGVKQVMDAGIADPQRMALVGFSYGGTLSFYASAHTTLFDAILSAEGIADLLGRAAQNGTFMATERQRAIFGVADIYDPAEQDTLAELSPLKYSDRVKTPLLIECGASSLANQDCIRYFRAVKQTGTPTELIVYPRTGHGVMEPALRYDSARRQMEWIDRYVKH